MKIAVKILKIIGIAILVIIVLLATLIFLIFTAPMVPRDYTKTAETGGEIEAAYMAAGQYQVKHIEAEATLVWLLEQNSDSDSVFYQKADTEHIGISGHSQGGVGVFNAVNEQKHSDMYTCAVSISPTEWAVACAIGMTYEPSRTDIPTMILAGAENDVPFDGLTEYGFQPCSHKNKKRTSALSRHMFFFLPPALIQPCCIPLLQLPLL